MHEWGREPLVKVAEIRPSNVDKKSNPGEAPVRLCNYMDVYTRDYITAGIQFMEATATPAEMQRFRVEHGDVLITKDSETPDDIGISSVVCDDIEDLVCGYHLALLKPNHKLVDPVYLAKQLASPETMRYFGRLANGSTRYGLSYGSIAATPIRLAPLLQQQRIAEILTTTDKAIEQTVALIAKTQQIKTGLMHDLFTRGIMPDGQIRPSRSEASHLYTRSPLGWIPKEWEQAELRRWLSCISYGFTNPMPETEEGPYMVTAADVLDGRIQYDTCRRTSDFAFERLLTQKSRPKLGDVLLTKDGTLGRLAIVDREQVCVNQSVAVLRPRDISDSQFLKALLGSPRWQQKMVLDAGGSTIKHIYITIVDKMIVPWPTNVDERRAMVDRLQACEAALDLENTNLGKLWALKHGLMQDLLTGSVRVARDEAGRIAGNV